MLNCKWLINLDQRGVVCLIKILLEYEQWFYFYFYFLMETAS